MLKSGQICDGELNHLHGKDSDIKRIVSFFYFLVYTGKTVPLKELYLSVLSQHVITRKRGEKKEETIYEKADSLAAPMPTKADPAYKAHTMGFRKDKMNTLQINT